MIDAYVKPAFEMYLDVLETDLRDNGFSGPLFIMQSNGGVMVSSVARTKPSYLLESGPAAGAIAVLKRGEQAGVRNLISYDMGGTTAKCGIVEDLVAAQTDEIEIDRTPEANRFLPGRAISCGCHPSS